MAKVDTLPAYLQPLMRGTSVRAPYCVVCGAPSPLNQHHVVRRGAGKMYKGGVEIKKPTLTLCGNGNASGCHGKAHAQTLHFRWVESREPVGAGFVGRQTTVNGGHWESMETVEPTKALKAQVLESDSPRVARWWEPIAAR